MVRFVRDVSPCRGQRSGAGDLVRPDQRNGSAVETPLAELLAHLDETRGLLLSLDAPCNPRRSHVQGQLSDRLDGMTALGS